MRVLVTGASGFAGGWLCRACLDDGDDVVGVSRSGIVGAGVEGGEVEGGEVEGGEVEGIAVEGVAVEGVAVDLRDAESIAGLVRRTRPDAVFHLAALSNVGRSWSAPDATLSANVGGAISLLEAVRHEMPDARVVWVSSSEVYGTVSEMPIGEGSVAAPESPYAVSKLAAEQLAGVYARAHGLRIVVARPFSHSGPGQSERYLLSNLARRAAAARRSGVASLRLTTGNGAVRRDITDVRDVVRAYRLLAAGDAAGPFNVCTGVTRSTAEQVAAIGDLVPELHVEHVVDPALVRASEVMELRGDPTALTAATGWRPQIPYATTLADTFAHWERELA